tara:strand:+ start:8592 stop:9218 length:627 start_codon:yes stop_codon:yes gene_type:complete
MLRPLNNIPLWEYKLTPDELAPVSTEVASIQANNYADYTSASSQLVGDIEHQYFLRQCVTDLDTVITREINLWEAQANFLHTQNYNTGKHAITSLGAWVNFQHPGENNPLHSHGGILSWVLWLKIPYTHEEEQAHQTHLKQTQPFAGMFGMTYTNVLGNIELAGWQLTKEMEGTLLLFPSKLKHCVYPYYSTDDVRISLSGNYAFSTN